MYAAMLETVDQSVGNIIEKLKEKGAYDNTVFVFYSDNGPTTDDVPCTPFMGGKNTTYEAGIRMPAIFTWKNHFKNNKISKERIISMDIFYTLLDIVGISDINVPNKDGVSLVEHLSNEKKIEKRDFYWHYPYNRPMYAGRSSAAILSKEGYKYIYFYNRDRPEVYDINKDKAEENDIYDPNNEMQMELAVDLATYLSSFGFAKMKKDMNN
jgi:arylsulfatase A-like enzyme